MNNPDHDSNVPRQLEIAMKHMRAIDVSDVPRNLVRQTRSAMLQAAGRRNWRMRLRRFAAAAAVMLALFGLTALMTRTSSSLAFAQLAERVNGTKTLRATIIRPPQNGTLLISGKRMRQEFSGTFNISDSATGCAVTIDPQGKTVIHSQGPEMGGALDFYGLFQKLATAAATPIEDYVDATGQHFPGVRGVAELKVGAETGKIRVKVWSDPKTKLPMRLEISSADDDNPRDVSLLEKIEFDIALDDALFDMTIPKNYKILGITRDQLKPPPDEKEAAKLTITPGVGIGEIKFGMSRKEIVALWGEPELVLYDTYLCYLSKGLQLVLVGREPPDSFGLIIANPGDAASLTRNDFPGQTDKGIRMGSSEQQIIDAYGEPDAKEKHSHSTSVGYSKLRLGFSLADGKVVQIIVNGPNR
jgi:hypothetical protein